MDFRIDQLCPDGDSPHLEDFSVNINFSEEKNNKVQGTAVFFSSATFGNQEEVTASFEGLRKIEVINFNPWRLDVESRLKDKGSVYDRHFPKPMEWHQQ